MSITSISDLVAGLAAAQRYLVTYAAQANAEAAGVTQSLLDRAGVPGAATLPTTLAGTAFTQASTGGVALVDPNPASLYLAGATINASLAGQLTLFDLLWANGGITATTTTGQTVTSATFPSRDLNSAALGEGCEMWLAVHTADGGNVSPVTNTTATYTNSGSTGSRSATIASYPATPRAGSMVKFTLAAGDTGVKSVQTLTLGTSYVSGTLNMLVVRRLADFAIPGATQAYQFNYGDVGLPKVLPTSFLFWAFTPASAAVGAINTAWLTFAAK